MTAPGLQGRLPVGAVLVAGVLLLVVHVSRYGVPEAPIPPTTALPGIDGQKVLALLRTLAAWAALNASAFSLGALFDAALPLPASLARLRTVYRLAIGLALLAVAVLGLAALHWLAAPAFAALLVVPPLVLAGWLRLRGGASALGIARPEPKAIAAACVYATLLVNAFLRAIGDDVGWDALTYHLAFPARYLDENGIFMTPFSHLSGYVASGQMLYLLALAIDGADLAVLLHFEFGVLTLAAVWGFARRRSFRAAMLAPLFLLADPLFQLELGWAYTDLTLALYTTLAAIALLAWMEDEGRPRALLYAGICAGVGCATRYLGANVAIALAALLWLPPRHRRVAENVRATVTLGLLVAVVMAPWLLRNLLFTGNPITPLLQSVFHAPGAEYIPPVVMDQSAEFLRFVGFGRDPLALLALPWNLVVESVPGTYERSFGFQVGALYVVGVGAALVIPSARRLLEVRALLTLVCIYVVLWFYSFQEARFLVPILPLAAIVGALAFDRAAAAAAGLGRALLLLPIAAALYGQLVLLPSFTVDAGSALGNADTRPGALRGSVAAAAFLREELGDDERILLWLEERAYLFRGVDYVPYHIGSGSPALSFVHGFAHGAALHCGLEELGVTHVLVNRNQRRATPGLYYEGYGEREYLRDLNRVDALLRGAGELVFERDGVTVHRLGDGHCG